MAKNSKKEVKEEPEEELMEDFIKFVKQEAEDEDVKDDTEDEEGPHAVECGRSRRDGASGELSLHALSHTQWSGKVL